MVRKDGDTMKECMKTNNPTEFRNAKKAQETSANLCEKYGISAEVRFNKAMDAYEREQNITPDLGVDLANGPDITAESEVQVTFKEENGVVWHKAKIVNTTFNVNLRAGTDIDSSILARVNPNSEFMAAATRNPDWYKVRLKDGTEGYMWSKYVAKVMLNEHT